MNWRIIILHSFLLLVGCLNQSNCQIIDWNLITNFKNNQFNSSPSVITITQDNQGIIYASNFIGLLSYDGVKWRKEIGESIFMGIFFAPKTNIFLYRSIDELGIINYKQNGQLFRTPLNNLFDSEINYPGKSINFKELDFDSILIEIDGKNYLYQPTENRVKTLKVTGSLINQSKDALINTKDGIIKYSNNEYSFLQPPKGAHLPFKLVAENETSLVAIDQLNNLFDEENILMEINPAEDDIYYMDMLRDNSVILTYPHKGIQIINPSNNTFIQYNKDNNLVTDFAKHVYEDREGNVWVSGQDGVSLLEYNSPWSILDKKSGIIGSPWTSKSRNDTLYIGSTSGLMIYSNNVITTTEIKEHVWSIDINKERLIIGSRKGWIVTDYLGNVLKRGDGLIYLVKLLDNEHFISCGSSGISIINLKTFNVRQHFDLPAQVYNSINVTDNAIWVTSKSNMIHKITGWGNSNSNSKLVTYSLPNQVSSPSPPLTIDFGEKAGYIFKDSIYVYNQTQDKFNFSYVFKEGNITQIHKIRDSNYLVFGKNKLEDYFLKEVNLEEQSYTIKSSRFNSFPFVDVPDINFNKNKAYFCSEEKVYIYDLQKDTNEELEYNTLIRSVNSSDSIIFSGHYFNTNEHSFKHGIIYQTDDFIPVLNYDQNAIRIEFAAAFYERPEKTVYSYKLVGNENTWSDWSKETIKEYNNLPAGDYTFLVKSKNVYNTVGKTASYRFKILPPWYKTYTAIFFFCLGGILIIWLFILAYTYRMRLQRRKLKLLVADRTFEVLSQKKEIEKQNLELKEQYEEIQQQRDAIDEKNQELEMSQEEILSINERLQELNLSLEKKVDERTTEIKATVKKLQSSIAELDTFIYRASHDLKGPISRINGLTSLAKLETSNPNDVKYYNLIELVAKDMNKLLAKLTQVHEVINCESEPEWVDLPVLITDIRNSIKFLDPDEKTKYSFALESTLQVKTDPYLLSVILTNLMENALIFKSPLSPVSEIKISSDQNDRQFVITIEDNGMGIPVEHIDKVFNMFYRGSDQSKGSGLGLYLAQMAAEKLGGKIKVESEFGQFTKLTLTIPKKIS